jgi:hypothetical protein
VSGQCHAPAAFYPRGKDLRYPLDRTLGGPHSWSGHRRQRRTLHLSRIEPWLSSLQSDPKVGNITKERSREINRVYFSSGFMKVTNYCSSEPGSSVSTVSGYGLDDRAIEFRSPAGAKRFFL